MEKTATLPKAPAAVSADLMSDAQLHAELMAGIDEADHAVDAADAFRERRG